MPVLGVIYALEKDNERMRVIHKQYKMKYESQRIHLAAYKEIPISWNWRVENSENLAQYWIENISTLVKT